MHPLDRVVVLCGGSADHLMRKVHVPYNLSLLYNMSNLTVTDEVRGWIDGHIKGGHKIITDVYRCFIIFETAEDASLFSIFWL